MIARRFELLVSGVDLQQAVERAAPYRRKHGADPLWIKTTERYGVVHLAARMKTHTVETTRGSYVPNGTVRGRIEHHADPGEAVSGVRVIGRMRWGFTASLLSLAILGTVVIGAMAIYYENAIIGWLTLLPLAFVAVLAVSLARMWGSDPVLLAEELTAVLEGRGEERRTERADALLKRLFPDAESRWSGRPDHTE